MTNIDKWIAQQCAEIKGSLTELAHPGEPCALIGYPDHWNAGDMAIWAGTTALLKELGVKIAYACDPWSYDPEKLVDALPYGPILLHGGGNFGDVYADEIYLRNRILNDFPHRNIIQLPQSIWFREERNIEEMANLLKKQRNFTMMVRDEASLRFAQEHFDVRTKLSPDYAIYLSDLRPFASTPESDIFALCRDDIETEHDTTTLSSTIPTSDWMTPGAETAGLSRSSRMLLKFLAPPVTGNYANPVSRSLAWKLYPLFWNKLALDRVRRGCGFLSKGRVVITDRLHGHILSLLMRKPHVVYDNENNKISSYIQSWPLADDHVRFSKNRQEAETAARDLLNAS